MESLQNIKRRMRSVKNIGQITHAMELVAATKMRRSQEVALRSRPYVFAALELLRNISKAAPKSYIPELLRERKVARTLFVLVASDKGLTGAFNANIFRRFEEYARAAGIDISSPQCAFMTVGEKARLYLEKKGVRRAEAVFTETGDYTEIEEIRPLTSAVLKGFLEGRWDRVVVCYTNFRSAMRQEATMREILPINYRTLEAAAQDIIPESGRFAELLSERGLSFFKEEQKALPAEALAKEGGEYLFEPSAQGVLDELLPHLFLMQMYNIILEANASEHSSRRLAMKNASDNSGEILGALTREYNKSRQAAITKELIEITSGAEALS